MRGMDDGQVAAWRHGITQRAHDAVGFLLVGYEVEDGHHQHTQGFAEVKQAPDFRVVEDRLWLADISLDDGGIGFTL